MDFQDLEQFQRQITLINVSERAPGEAANCAQRTLAPERHGARPRAARAARGAPRARPAHALQDARRGPANEQHVLKINI